MDSWPSTREVEKPKPAKVRAAEEAEFLKLLDTTSDPAADVLLLSRKRVARLAGLLRELAGAGRG